MNARHLVCAIALVMSVPALASAQEPPPAPAPAPSPASGRDIVVLKDGTRYEGTLIEQKPGKWVIIETADGVRTITWDDVKEIVAAPKPRPKVGAGAAETDDEEVVAAKKKGPKATSEAGATIAPDGSLKAGASQQCGEDEPDCKKSIAVEVGKDGAKAGYHSEEDCSSDADEDCLETVDAHADSGGVGFGYKKESVKAVKKPPRANASFNLGLAFQMGFGDHVSFFTTGADLGLRILAGSKFPDRKGGNWFGIFVEPSASFAFGTIKIDAVCTSTGYGSFCTEAQSDRFSLIRLGSGLGVQWMRFGRSKKPAPGAKKPDLSQSGFGLALGGIVGAAISKTGGHTSSSFTGGPVLSVLFPKYNPGTARFSYTQINAMLLPMKNFFTFAVSATFGFG